MIRDLFRIDENESEGEILLYKLFEGFVAINAVRLAWTWAFYIERIQENVHPLGLARYIDVSVFYHSPLAAWNAAAVTVLSVLIVVFPWRWIPWIALALLHVQLVARDALGEISHSANFIGMSLLAIALGRSCYNAGTDRRRFIVGTTIFFVGFGYVSAAMCKLIGTGFSWADGRHLWMWMSEKGTDILSRDGAFEMNALQRLARESYGISTAILSVGLISESLGFLLWFRRTRTIIAAVLIGMHTGISLTMNIRFDIFIYELLLIGFPWAAVFDRWLPRLSESFRKPLLHAAGHRPSAKSS